VLQIYILAHSDTPQCRTPLHTRLFRLFVCHLMCVDMYEYVCMYVHMHIHLYSLSSIMTGSCHVCCVTHSLSCVLCVTQFAMCAVCHTVCHVCCVSHSLPWLFSPWQLCCNIHIKFLAINTQLFCTQTWYRFFTPCCSKYSLPNIQCIWLFKGNWSGGLILLSQLPI